MEIVIGGQVFRAKAMLVELEDGRLVGGEADPSPAPAEATVIAPEPEKEKPKRRGGGRKKAAPKAAATAAPKAAPKPKAEPRTKADCGRGTSPPRYCVPLDECEGFCSYRTKNGWQDAAIYKTGVRADGTRWYSILWINKKKTHAISFTKPFWGKRENMSDIVLL